MAVDNCGRDMVRLCVYAPQVRPCNHVRGKGRRWMRAMLRKLGIDLRRPLTLFDSDVVKTQKDQDKLRDLALRTIGLCREAKLPIAPRDEIGLLSKPKTTVQVEDGGKAPL